MAITVGKSENGSEKQRKWLRYVILSAVALAIAGMYIGSGDLAALEGTAAVFALLSDGFLMPGVLFAGIGGLSWVASKGLFDIFSFGASDLFGRFLPFNSVFRRGDKFYDYKQEKAEKRRPWKADLLLVGVGCLVCSLLCLLVYSCV